MAHPGIVKWHAKGERGQSTATAAPHYHPIKPDKTQCGSLPGASRGEAQQQDQILLCTIAYNFGGERLLPVYFLMSFPPVVYSLEN